MFRLSLCLKQWLSICTELKSPYPSDFSLKLLSFLKPGANLLIRHKLVLGQSELNHLPSAGASFQEGSCQSWSSGTAGRSAGPVALTGIEQWISMKRLKLLLPVAVCSSPSVIHRLWCQVTLKRWTEKWDGLGFDSWVHQTSLPWGQQHLLGKWGGRQGVVAASAVQFSSGAACLSEPCGHRLPLI